MTEVFQVPLNDLDLNSIRTDLEIAGLTAEQAFKASQIFNKHIVFSIEKKYSGLFENL